MIYLSSGAITVLARPPATAPANRLVIIFSDFVRFSGLAAGLLADVLIWTSADLLAMFGSFSFVLLLLISDGVLCLNVVLASKDNRIHHNQYIREASYRSRDGFRLICVLDSSLKLV